MDAKPPLLQVHLCKLKMLSKVLSKVLSHLSEDEDNSLCMRDTMTFQTAQREGVVLQLLPQRNEILNISSVWLRDEGFTCFTDLPLLQLENMYLTHLLYGLIPQQYENKLKVAPVITTMDLVTVSLPMLSLNSFNEEIKRQNRKLPAF